MILDAQIKAGNNFNDLYNQVNLEIDRTKNMKANLNISCSNRKHANTSHNVTKQLPSGSVKVVDYIIQSNLKAENWTYGTLSR